MTIGAVAGLFRNPARSVRGDDLLDQVLSQDSPAFLAVSNVSVTYANGTAALKPVSIGIHKQDVTVLLGPSGAGKSTLLRVLNGLVRPTQGMVASQELGSLSTTAAMRKHRRSTGMVFQQHQLIGRLTALQNVLLSRIGHYGQFRTLLPMPMEERRWALACLDRVGLLEKALVRCDSLSGGQQQRVGIARAIAQRPGLILADEPVASLDPASSERVLGMLRQVSKRDGIPTVVSLHQLEYARQFADRIIGLSAGRVVFDGPPQKLDDEALGRIYNA